MHSVSAAMTVVMTYSFHSEHLAKLTTSQDSDFGRTAQGGTADRPVCKVRLLRCGNRTCQLMSGKTHQLLGLLFA